MVIKKLLLILSTVLILILFQGAVIAQTPSLSIQPKSGTLRDSFLFSITFDNPQSKSTPTIQENDDFRVRYVGPQQSVQIINGSMQSSIAYFFRLSPKRSGELKTPPIVLNGVPLSIPPLQVTVSDTNSQDSQETDDILFDQYITPKVVYRGQQVLNTLEIATTVKLHKLQVHYTPMTSFWTEEISPPDKDQVVKNGAVYTVIRSHRALFPLKNGELTIPARRFTALADRGRIGNLMNHLDPFDPQFFGSIMGSGGDEVELRTTDVKIEVKDLPSPPKEYIQWGPGDPIVGNTTLKVSSDKIHASAGSSLNVTVLLESEGNINPITEINWGDTPQWKIYQEQPNSSKRFEGGKVVFTKEFRCSFIPATGGSLEIPKLKISYFDPDQGRYITTSSEPIPIEVDGPVKQIESVHDENSVDVGTAPDRSESPTPLQYWPYGACFILLSLLLYQHIHPKNIPMHPLPTQTPYKISHADVASIRSLYSVFINAIQDIYVGSKHSLSIRAELKDVLLDSPIRFEIESLLDEIEEYLYGKDRVITEEDFQRIKEEVFVHLKKWGKAQ